MENEDLIAKEILSTSIDLGMDYGDIALDDIWGDEIIKHAPIIKTLAAFIKTGTAIKERFFIKKFLSFLQAVHGQKIAPDKLQEFKEKFDSDKKYREAATDQILILTDRLSSINKSKILAHLFRAHIEGAYDWEHFLALAECLDKLQEISYPYLKALSKHGFGTGSGKATLEVREIFKEQENKELDEREYTGLIISAGIVWQYGYGVTINKLGQNLYNFGIVKILSIE